MTKINRETLCIVNREQISTTAHSATYQCGCVTRFDQPAKGVLYRRGHRLTETDAAVCFGHSPTNPYNAN